jgi:hypothetical protein
VTLAITIDDVPVGAKVTEAAPSGDPEITQPERRRDGLVIGHTTLSNAEGFLVPAVTVLRGETVMDRRVYRGARVWEEALPLVGDCGPLEVDPSPRSRDAALNTIFRSLAVQKSYGPAAVHLLYIALTLLDAGGWVERYEKQRAEADRG